jgi:hypothetical protein
MLNPMHRLWSDGRWNKLTVAHGCYWKKCSFCDVGLDYIGALRRRHRRDAGRPHRGHRGRDRADRLPLRRRGGAAQVAEGAGGRTAAPAAAHQLVGQHPLREELHARAVPIAGRQRLHRHLGRAGGGVRPAAGADEQGRVGGPGGARDQGLCRRRHPGARVPDVRLSDPDHAGHRGRAGIRAPAVCRGLHPVGLLPPLCLHRAFAGGAGPGALRRHAAAAAAPGLREERRRLPRPHRRRPRRAGRA